MIYFGSRSAARSFKSNKSGFKLVDMGSSAPANRRWGVKVL